MPAALPTAELPAAERIDAAFRRIHARESTIHAFAEIDEDRARADAAAIDRERARGIDRGPLHGMPVAIKDTIDAEGFASRAACPARDGALARVDAPVVAALRRAGAIVIGKATTWELGCGVGEIQGRSTTPEAANPNDPRYFAGGSSSGSAAAIAAGFAMASLGADTGGSIRSPASACGIAGLKPSFGAVDRGGAIAHSHTLDHIGPMAATARDLIPIFAVLSGWTIPAARPGFAGAKIGIVAEGLDPAALDPQIGARFAEIVGVLELSGCIPAETSIGAPLDAWRQTLEVIGGYEAAPRHANLRHAAAAPSPSVLDWIERSAAIPHSAYWAALGQREKLCAGLQHAMANVDFLISPSALETVPKSADETARISYSLNSPNAVYNLSGHPAVSIPMGRDANGLPMGMQIAARRGGDFELLVFAAWLEERLANPDTQKP